MKAWQVELLKIMCTLQVKRRYVETFNYQERTLDVYLDYVLSILNLVTLLAQLLGLIQLAESFAHPHPF